MKREKVITLHYIIYYTLFFIIILGVWESGENWGRESQSLLFQKTERFFLHRAKTQREKLKRCTCSAGRDTRKLVPKKGSKFWRKQWNDKEIIWHARLLLLVWFLSKSWIPMQMQRDWLIPFKLSVQAILAVQLFVFFRRILITCLMYHLLV